MKGLSPEDEMERLEALRRYHILDTPPDRAFDHIAEVAAGLFRVPIAMVCLVDKDRIWFKSHYGIETQQVAREHGLCASVIPQKRRRCRLARSRQQGRVQRTWQNPAKRLRVKKAWRDST